MNKFMLILSDKNDLALQVLRDSVLEDLNPTSPVVVLILPHIVLFHHAGDLEFASRTVQKHLSAGSNWMLIQVHPEFLGTVRASRMAELEKFFAS